MQHGAKGIRKVDHKRNTYVMHTLTIIFETTPKETKIAVVMPTVKDFIFT